MSPKANEVLLLPSDYLVHIGKDRAERRERYKWRTWTARQRLPRLSGFFSHAFAQDPTEGFGIRGLPSPLQCCARRQHIRSRQSHTTSQMPRPVGRCPSSDCPPGMLINPVMPEAWRSFLSAKPSRGTPSPCTTIWRASAKVRRSFIQYDTVP